jgi:HK97 gp10 family phage protein
MTLTGMDDVRRAFKRAPEVAKKHAAEAVGFSLLKLAQRTRAITPVGPTGELQRSIAVTHNTGNLTGWVGVRGDSPARKYWFAVEFGNVHAPAQPFLRPAAEAFGPTFISDLTNIGPAIEHEMGE